MRLATALLLFGSLLLQSCVPSAVGPAPFKSKLDQVIDTAIAEKRIVGAVVLVAKDGKLIYQRAAGHADREAGRPMRVDSLFRLSSLTKPYVSATALALVEEGKLSLDDAVTKWIPDFRPRLASGEEAVITVRHLMTHTAGLGYTFLEPEQGPLHQAGVSDGLDQVPFGLEENLQRLASVPLLFPPGAAWTYSLATDVLGEVIARAAGKSLPEAVREQVTRPLRLRDTGFSARDPRRLAVPYVNADPEPVPMVDGQQVPFGASAVRFSPSRARDASAYHSGGSGMIGTAADFLRLLEELRQSTGAILSPESVTALTTVQTGDMNIFMAPGCGWSLGFPVVKDPTVAGLPSGTFKWAGIYGHVWWVDPINKLTVVILTNTALEGITGRFPGEVGAAIYTP